MDFYFVRGGFFLNLFVIDDAAVLGVYSTDYYKVKWLALWNLMFTVSYNFSGTIYFFDKTELLYYNLFDRFMPVLIS